MSSISSIRFICSSSSNPEEYNIFIDGELKLFLTFNEGAIELHEINGKMLYLEYVTQYCDYPVFSTHEQREHYLLLGLSIIFDKYYPGHVYKKNSKDYINPFINELNEIPEGYRAIDLLFNCA